MVASYSKHQFNAKLAKLVQFCEKHKLKLFSNKDNYLMGTYICVLSYCEYEIGEPLSKCDDSQESYYMTPHDFDVYIEITMN